MLKSLLAPLRNTSGLARWILLSGLVVRETKAYLKFDPTLRARPDDIQQFMVETKNPWRS